MKAGRNDPCPCGSGQKFKKCCLVKEQQAQAEDFEYFRLRDIESKLIPRLERHAFEAFGEDALDNAWLWFNDGDEDELFDPGDPLNQAFVPWFLFNYEIDHEDDRPAEQAPLHTTVAESFLKAYERRLTADEKAILAAANRRPWTLCEIVEVKPGAGLVLSDLLRRRQYEVIERSASRQLRRGEIILCATMLPLGSRVMNIGTAPYPLPPTAKRGVMELRRTIAGHHDGAEELTDEMVAEDDAFVIGHYLDVLAELFNPRPSLANTEGEPLVPHKMIFEVQSVARAFDGLWEMASGESRDDLLGEAETDGAGAITEVEIPWLKPGSSEAPLVLGRMTIAGTKLIAETNSKERADRLRGEIERRLGAGVKYRSTVIEPIESRLHEALAQPAGSGAIPRDQLPPEALERLSSVVKDHWRRWFDEPVPALGGLTPREAATTEEGRDLLQSLLLDYERQNELAADKLLQVDVEALRRELGLSDGR